MNPSNHPPIGPAGDLKNLAAALRDKVGATAVWLFGSRARGDGRPDSDFDILAIIESSTLSRYQRAVHARKSTQDIRLPKDIIVLTKEEWNRGLEAPCSLPGTVVREGIRLL